MKKLLPLLFGLLLPFLVSAQEVVSPPIDIYLKSTASPELETILNEVFPSLETQLNIKFNNDPTSQFQVYLLGVKQTTVASFSLSLFIKQDLKEISTILQKEGYQSAESWLSSQTLGSPPINRLLMSRANQIDILTNLKTAFESYIKNIEPWLNN